MVAWIGPTRLHVAWLSWRARSGSHAAYQALLDGGHAAAAADACGLRIAEVWARPYQALLWDEAVAQVGVVVASDRLDPLPLTVVDSQLLIGPTSFGPDQVDEIPFSGEVPGFELHVTESELTVPGAGSAELAPTIGVWAAGLLGIGRHTGIDAADRAQLEALGLSVADLADPEPLGETVSVWLRVRVDGLFSDVDGPVEIDLIARDVAVRRRARAHETIATEGMWIDAETGELHDDRRRGATGIVLVEGD